MNLYRQNNILLYLNPQWAEAAGGCFELWAKAKSSPEKVIVPAWGRCVIFTSDEQSVHGFPTLADGHWRRSLALYYKAQEAPNFSGDATRYWKEYGLYRALQRARLVCHWALLSKSRGFSLLAHLVNPNQGVSWWRTRTRRIGRRQQKSLARDVS